MLKPKIKRMKQQGYKQSTIRRKLKCSKSHVSEVLSKKKCVKKPHRITSNEYKMVLNVRNAKR